MTISRRNFIAFGAAAAAMANLPGFLPRPLKVPGLDPLPTGTVFNEISKQFSLYGDRVVLDGWDLRGINLIDWEVPTEMVIRNCVMGNGREICDS